MNNMIYVLLKKEGKSFIAAFWDKDACQKFRDALIKNDKALAKDLEYKSLKKSDFTIEREQIR